MLVPAMAFAWCVVSLPVRSPAATRTAHVTVRAPRESTDGAPERTVVRGPIAPDVIAFAKTLVNLPMGAEQFAEIDGQHYVFVLERHYHPPGFVGAPSGWHKGVTAYELQ